VLSSLTTPGPGIVILVILTGLGRVGLRKGVVCILYIIQLCTGHVASEQNLLSTEEILHNKLNSEYIHCFIF